MIRALADAQMLGISASPEMDPLTQEGALLETQLLDIWINTLTSTAGLLFDLRTALELLEGNAAAIFLYGVEGFQWAAEPRTTGRTAWNVIGSTPAFIGDRFTVSLGFSPDATLDVVARGARFYLGNVPGLPPTPPDFTQDDEETIRAGMPVWESPFHPLHATSIGDSTVQNV
jgi:hypothetical protein